MLDHLSCGRFELGVGRGVSPIEGGFLRRRPASRIAAISRSVALIKQGLTVDELTFSGEFYDFERVPMVLRAVQKPYPPLWYGVVSPEGTHWAALENARMVTLLPTDGSRAVIDRFKAEWAGR